MKWQPFKSAFRPKGCEELYQGKWVIGSVYLDDLIPQTIPDKYRADTKLPGIRPLVGYYETIEQAKKALEQAVTRWFEKAEDVPHETN